MMPVMDAVFRALADPTRRSLLDELFKQDGQTLSALEQRLPLAPDVASALGDGHRDVARPRAG
jgi:DNA-binding transcriptional ArsR family regulator